MRVRLTSIALGWTLFASLAGLSQAPSKPDNATAQCKDLTYWTGASKSGACRDHDGIKTWYGAPANAAAAPASAASPAPSAPAKPNPTAAPGGGPGMVWVNTSTKVYHCYGDRNYGTTKAGKYMSEADAKTMGAKPSRGQACSK